MSCSLDHLDIDDVRRRLIERAVDGSPKAYLAPLDKGLSGASVWRARWELPASGAVSALHVFKIGATDKLQREHDAIRSIASVIDSKVVTPILVSDGDMSLLRQPFSGDDPGRVDSLKDYLRRCEYPKKAVEIIQKLYRQRLRTWHYAEDRPRAMRRESLRAALDWWVSRTDLDAVVGRLGRKAIDDALQRRHAISLSEVSAGITEILDAEGEYRMGPVHGDLHSQNVLVDSSEVVHLIDFGWCSERWIAIDYMMLECSLKYVVAPRLANLTDLLDMNQRIEEASIDLSDDGKWDDSILYGMDLEKVARCVMEIRSAALDHQAVVDIGQYEQGLVALTYGLLSMPAGINHPYMIHSLAAATAARARVSR